MVVKKPRVKNKKKSEKEVKITDYFITIYKYSVELHANRLN